MRKQWETELKGGGVDLIRSIVKSSCLNFIVCVDGKCRPTTLTQINEFYFVKLVKVIVYTVYIHSIYLLCGVLDQSVILLFINHARKVVAYVKLFFLAFKSINQTLF